MFHDRHEAGRALADALSSYSKRGDAMVLALPRGGVPVAYEVATTLALPLDVLIVRKLGVPGHEELAMGAIAPGGIQILNQTLMEKVGVSYDELAGVIADETRELERREVEYRRNRPPLEVRGKTVIVVDDGLATGSTMRAAVAALRRLHPNRIVVAVPVGAGETCDELRREADEVVAILEPRDFTAVGAWYEDFSQTTDKQVRVLLNRTFEASPDPREPKKN